MSEEIAVVHMHPQPGWHDDAYIVANRKGLIDLKEAIEKALLTGNGTTMISASDSEGSDLYIQLIDKSLDSNEWETAALPYSEEGAFDTRPNAVWPWQRK